MVDSFFDTHTECLIIQVKARFDYHCQKAFKEAFLSVKNVMSYEVNLANVLHLDSSALGMLLLLRDHAGERSTQIRLVHVNRAVINTLKMANFHRLFEITE
ncbi:STAS domain-containing protein [Marinomonas sp. A79]|uniref:STAS domain-containing protein n=1 Tax=Marinomonas vulgaris TaxID=2823372 RepID=A0ABS5HAJ5_9GAMM|nr:STAS domain-containing protein [Marinomonas vulgaris]MBR7888691.1 STAS domain-containing protein [Marinomonas vulgaris]